MAVLVTVLDQHSTYLAMTNNPLSRETSTIPRWFIEGLGAGGLAVWGLIKVVVYVGVYGGLAASFKRWGLPGVGRSGFVLITYAYLFLAIPVVINNYNIA